MADIDLSERFPSMKPVGSAPPLVGINGIGVRMYGKRNFDAETQTYLSTWCLTVLFVPLFCLRTYRVAGARNGGWYFLGREPMSGLARGYNVTVLAAMLLTAVAVPVVAHLNSPEYRARELMRASAALAGRGRFAEAAANYERLALAGTYEAGAATAALRELLGAGGEASPAMAGAPVAEVVPVAVSAVRVARQGRGLSGPDVANAVYRLVAASGTSDPRSATAALDAVLPLVVDGRKFEDLRFALLSAWAAKEPENLDVVVPLAGANLARGEPAKAKALLLAVRGRLGDGDGALVLGRILSKEGDYGGAHDLLWAYARPRLATLKSAEASYRSVEKRVEDREVEALRSGRAPADLYKKYDAAGTKAEKDQLVRAHMDERLRSDDGMQQAQNALEEAVKVVPVAMELGMISLERARSAPSPEARKSLLEQAEEVFLAVGGVAGESDTYRLSLSQVYYWLGKFAEGRKLLDDLLAERKRDPGVLVEAGGVLRMAGIESEARELIEEGYRTATKDEERFAAASARVVMCDDEDERLLWIGRCDLRSPWSRALFARLKGNKAYSEGRDDEASGLYREALALLDSMPRGTGTLNESALALMALHGVTGDPKTYEQAVDRFQQAADLAPTDSVLLHNAGGTLLEGAMDDVASSGIDTARVRGGRGATLFGYLYSDEAGRAQIVAKVRVHPGVKRAMGMLDRSMVVAPKSVRSYGGALSVLEFTGDAAGLEALERRIAAAGVDTADSLRRMNERIKDPATDRQGLAATVTAVARDGPLLADLRARIAAAPDAVARARAAATAAAEMCLQAYQQQVLGVLGGVPDVGLEIALAREADATAPSLGTRYAVVSALMHKIQADVRKADPAFDAYCAEHGRFSTPRVVVAAALEPGSPFRARLAAHPDMAEVVRLSGEIARVSATHPDAVSWAVLRDADPAAAALLAENMRSCPHVVPAARTTLLLSPASVPDVLEAYWLYQALGRQDEARAVVAAARDRGLPLPVGR